MLTLQIVDLLRQTGPAAECFAGEVLATDLHRLLRLPLQLALLLLELAHLQFEPLAARGDVRDTATHLLEELELLLDRKSTRLNSSHVAISYAVFCLKKNHTR